MNEDTFNIDIRKFLKHFGVTAQREIEKAVASALEAGTLRGDETLRVHATLTIEGLPADHRIDGEIRLA
jgi:ribosomal protein L1